MRHHHRGDQQHQHPPRRRDHQYRDGSRRGRRDHQNRGGSRRDRRDASCRDHRGHPGVRRRGDPGLPGEPPGAAASIRGWGVAPRDRAGSRDAPAQAHGPFRRTCRTGCCRVGARASVDPSRGCRTGCCPGAGPARGGRRCSGPWRRRCRPGPPGPRAPRQQRVLRVPSRVPQVVPREPTLPGLPVRAPPVPARARVDPVWVPRPGSDVPRGLRSSGRSAWPLASRPGPLARVPPRRAWRGRPRGACAPRAPRWSTMPTSRTHRSRSTTRRLPCWGSPVPWPVC